MVTFISDAIKEFKKIDMQIRTKKTNFNKINETFAKKKKKKKKKNNNNNNDHLLQRIH